MTTTQEVIARIHPGSIVGALPLDLHPGDVLFDSVLPHTGLALVEMIRPTGLTMQLDLLVVMDDGTTADETFTWHSTLPLGRIPGITAGYVEYGGEPFSGGYFSVHDSAVTRAIRRISGCDELVDALDAAVI